MGNHYVINKKPFPLRHPLGCVQREVTMVTGCLVIVKSERCRSECNFPQGRCAIWRFAPRLSHPQNYIEPTPPHSANCHTKPLPGVWGILGLGRNTIDLHRSFIQKAPPHPPFTQSQRSRIINSEKLPHTGKTLSQYMWCPFYFYFRLMTSVKCCILYRYVFKCCTCLHCGFYSLGNLVIGLYSI